MHGWRDNASVAAAPVARVCVRWLRRIDRQLHNEWQRAAGPLVRQAANASVRGIVSRACYLYAGQWRLGTLATGPVGRGDRAALIALTDAGVVV